MSDSGPDCSDFHSLNVSDICRFVRNTSSCGVDEGFVNYTEFLYCTLGSVSIVIACILLLIWWFFLFCGLATTADDFFCPALAVISQSLKLSHNVAGVTFLAFGNGAPDIFSAIAAIGSAEAGDAGLAIGALFGAGVFVTAVVAGSIAIIHPFTCMQRPFLRDVIFYLGATFWTFVCMWDKVIEQWEAIGFIVLYAIYVLVVIVGRYINQKLKTRMRGSFLGKNVDESYLEIDEEIHLKATDVLDHEPSSSTGYDDEDDGARAPLLRQGTPASRQGTPVIFSENHGTIQTEIRYYKDDIDFGVSSLWGLLLHGINPINTEEWGEMRIFMKIYECFKSPLVLLLRLTIPIVDLEEDPEEPGLRNWNRPLNSLQLFTGPLFAMMATKLGFHTIGGDFPVWSLVMIICLILSIVVFATTKTDKRPFYHTAFAYLGFIVAIVWIYSVANEIVNILQALGVVFSLSDAILGLTLLAWGNSIGDLISDMTMARQGYPRMGISACFGGPLFNLLMGLGIPFTISCVSKGEPFKLQTNLEEMVLAAGLGLSLIVSLIVVPLSGFRMSRPYGIGLIVLYIGFLTVAVLTEVNIIPNTKL